MYSYFFPKGTWQKLNSWSLKRFFFKITTHYWSSSQTFNGVWTIEAAPGPRTCTCPHLQENITVVQIRLTQVIKCQQFSKWDWFGIIIKLFIILWHLLHARLKTSKSKLLVLSEDTHRSRRVNSPLLAPNMSIILPGVHTMISAPLFSSAICKWNNIQVP